MIKFILLFASFVTSLLAMPEVIFINGPSCSGKTTVAQSLQTSLEEPYLYLSFDKIIEMTPDMMKHWYEDPGFAGFSTSVVQDEEGHLIARLEMGTYARSLHLAFINMCCSLVLSGHKLIIEDVFFNEDDLPNWEKRLKDFSVLWVGLKAPLNLLEDREQTLGKWPGCARFQYFNAFSKDKYDLNFDTSVQNLASVVDTVIENLDL